MATERGGASSRDVVVTGPSGHSRARLAWWSEGQAYVVQADGPFGEHVGRGDDLFDALVAVRRELEPQGWFLAVQGARLDAYPSGMCRDMGGGARLYALRLGEQARQADLVDTFGDTDPEYVGRVDEQRAYFDRWLQSLRG